MSILNPVLQDSSHEQPFRIVDLVIGGQGLITAYLLGEGFSLRPKLVDDLAKTHQPSPGINLGALIITEVIRV